MMKLFLPFFFLVLLGACSETPEAAKEPVTVEGERVILAEPDKAAYLKTAAVRRDAGSELRLPGRLVWNEDKTVRIFPQLGGRVLRIEAEIGAPVKAGQTLATLASADFGQARAEAGKAQADLAVAQKALARSRELHAAGVIAGKDWEQAQADALRAGAEAERASRRLAALGGSEDGVYRLKSPLAGVVVEKNLNPGQEFRPDQAGTPLFVVTDPASLWVQLDANEADLAALRPGGAFAIEVKQYPAERFTGTIRHVADFVDPGSRTIKVRGEVDNRDRRLKGELFITARIAVPPANALQVPAGAVFLVGGQRYVLVEEAAGRYLRRAVRTGAEQEGWVTLESGVKEGEKVVVEGNLHLAKFLKPPAETPAAAATAEKAPDGGLAENAPGKGTP